MLLVYKESRLDFMARVFPSDVVSLIEHQFLSVRAGTSPSVNYPTGAARAGLTNAKHAWAADATVRSISGAGKRHPPRPEIRCSIDRFARHVVAMSTLALRRVTRRETLSDDDLDTVEVV
jgi:hypothetical protein